MVQVRKLVLAIAAASALSSGMAQALGLGELTLKSTQNQPLLAEIELLDVKSAAVRTLRQISGAGHVAQRSLAARLQRVA